MFNFIEYGDLKNLEHLQHSSNLKDIPVRKKKSGMAMALLGLLQERPFNLSIWIKTPFFSPNLLISNLFA